MRWGKKERKRMVKDWCGVSYAWKNKYKYIMFDMQNKGWMLRGITLILRKVMVDVTKYYTCNVKKRWISLRIRKMSRR